VAIAGTISRAWAAWKRFGHTMANLVGVALFTILYVLVFSPIALVMKLRGRKFLPHFRGDEATFFLPKAKIAPTLESMRRQG
jgi:hypothetical protein